MGFGLSDLKDILDFGAVKYVQIEGQRQQYELAGQELAYKTAQEKRAQVDAAATASANLINSDIVKKIVFWTLTTIAGGVLTTVVIKAAGIK